MSMALDPSETTLESSMARSKKFFLDQSISIAEQLSGHELDERDVCLDFANIEGVNSAELSALIRFALRMRRQEKSVFLSHVGRHLQEIFEITRFHYLIASQRR